MKQIGWGVMTFFAVAVSGYAFTLVLYPDAGPPFLANRLETIPWAVYGHFLGGGLALLVGAFQMNARLRSRFLGTHRWLGWVYVMGCLVGGVSGLALALRAEGGIAGRLGFGLLAVAWLTSTGLGYARIMGGHVAAHGVWMTRSYALTLAAVTLRIYIPLSLIAGLPFEQAYPAIAWACWVPNLVIAEWFILNPATGRAMRG